MPPHGLGMGCKWEEQRTLRGRSRSVEWTELFQCSSRPMLYMSSEERDFECPGGLWRPGIRFFSLLACH